MDTLLTGPANPSLIWWVLSQPTLVLTSFLVGRLTRFLLRGRVTVSDSAATLITLMGLWLGLLLSAWLFQAEDLMSPKMLITACSVAAVVLIVASAILAQRQRHRVLAPIAEMARLGESDRLEFKSSARWNLRTDKRDEAMETVVAKTVTAFLNSSGGTLLLGVDDDGTLIGLGPDYTTLKQPDADRFELWLRDMWRTRLGTNAAALPLVDFAPTPQGDAEVCRITVPPAPWPVYLRSKGRDAELWVRVGNSTRRLEVDDAVDYVSLRWPRINRVSWPTRIGDFLLRRDRVRPLSPAAIVTARAERTGSGAWDPDA
ncbi:helix-turn-helix domain-containing protein [Actinomyces slackii]|uniref:Divergent AAA domain n=1 Tax=Actinomyces slackii TaxID=52774 RepID=A0A448KAL9_9ACTO|nr:ATP-binding protein [Actinomyces slackii]VEG73969.1 Divergent AAA domain [Actinomyces slackii]